jgi:hypothetical protein
MRVALVDVVLIVWFLQADLSAAYVADAYVVRTRVRLRPPYLCPILGGPTLSAG